MIRLLSWNDIFVKHNKSKICDFFFTDNSRVDLQLEDYFWTLTIREHRDKENR